MTCLAVNSSQIVVLTLVRKLVVERAGLVVPDTDQRPLG